MSKVVLGNPAEYILYSVGYTHGQQGRYDAEMVKANRPLEDAYNMGWMDGDGDKEDL